MIQIIDRIAITPRGKWVQDLYNKLDIVELDGSSYMCVADGTSTEPPGTGWVLFAEKG